MSGILTQPKSGTDNMPMLRSLKASGHKAAAPDFSFKITSGGLPELNGLTFPIQSMQVPEIRRKLIETKGPFGHRVPQQGGPKKDGKMSITFMQIDPEVCNYLRKLSDDKIYFEAKLIGSSKNIPEIAFDLSSAWIEMGNSTAAVLHYGWFE